MHGDGEKGVYPFHLGVGSLGQRLFVFERFFCFCLFISSNGNSNVELLFHFFADIDECSSARLHTCASNAQCINTKGAFNCTCRNGFQGNGYYCEGE